jgi:N-acetylmuramic acid 6-phosphate etherase
MAENLSALATESSSTYQDLEKQTVDTILRQINAEDKTVPLAVEKVIPSIEPLVHEIVKRMKQGGRLFYIGAGTSGRLGVVDASECPPTYGVPHDWVIGLIAGGDSAIRKAVENAEDDEKQASQDLVRVSATKDSAVEDLKVEKNNLAQNKQPSASSVT